MKKSENVILLTRGKLDLVVLRQNVAIYLEWEVSNYKRNKMTCNSNFIIELKHIM